jgi:hypothetical protein
MILRLLYWLLACKGGDIMVVMFFAQRVILGKTKYAEVPSTLKAGVLEVLTDSGLEFLAEDK